MTDQPRHAVCVCSDAHMLLPALYVAAGARSHSRRFGTRYDVIVVTGRSDATEQHRHWMRERAIVHCDDMDFSALADITIGPGRLTKGTLFKLLLAGHFADRYEKILYLDADTAIHDEVGAIFALDTGPYPIAAAPAGRLWAAWTPEEQERAEAHFKALGMTAPYRYINSGVLLIDTAKWNREDLGTRALNFIRQHPDLCRLPDEDALNGLLDGRQAELSPLWNMRGTAWAHRAIRDATRPVVVHYDGPNKPWKRFGSGRRLFELEAAYRDYSRFARASPWPGWLATQWRWRDLYDNLRFEAKVRSRQLRGRPVGGWSGPRPEFASVFLRWCAEGRFADIEQGIVARSGHRLALAT